MRWIIALSVLVLIGRTLVPGHGLSWPGTYEAFAHIWVGALIVLVCLKKYRYVAALCLAALTAFETAMFLSR